MPVYRVIYSIDREDGAFVPVRSSRLVAGDSASDVRDSIDIHIEHVSDDDE